MQESLYLLTDRQKLFGGYYLMTFRQALKRVDAYGMPIRGYLGEFVDRHDTHHPFCRNVPLYETLFSSVDTSFVRMDRDWKGRLTPIFMDRFAAEAKREEVVHRIHKGALSFIEEAASIFGSHLKNLDIEPVKSLRVLEKFFSEPHPVDAQMFVGLVFEDAYGGAGLKTILPIDGNPEANCVWKVGAAVLQRANSDKKATSTTVAPKATSPKSAVQTKKFNRIEQRLVRWVVRKTSNDRKFQKFELTPAKFFSDSKSPHVRLLGRLYLIRAANQ